MASRRQRFSPTFSPIGEVLESRLVQSAGGLASGAVEVAAQAARKVATVTTLAVQAGTLGQPVTFTATVRGPASAGSPTGTVAIVTRGNVVQTLALSPTSSGNAHFATSQATFTLTPQPGGPAFYFGKYSVTAEYTPTGSFSKGVATRLFTVGQPAYTTLADGVKLATIAPGTGPAIQAGQTANVLYTGYLASNGQIFDMSSSHGGTPLSFPVGQGDVIPGYDAGTLGMKVGESRIILIPSADGYGATANGAIPANSNLVFVQTLESIS